MVLVNGKIFALALLAFIVFSGCAWPNGAPVEENDSNSAGAGSCDDSIDNTCLPNQAQSPGLEGEAAGKNIRVEVFHFHFTRQCYSCIRLGELAEATVNEFFKEEIGSGKIVFGHLNVDSEENRELTLKYGASGASLWIGTYIDGVFHKEQNAAVWYKINKEEEFKSYLKGIIEKRLSGELE